MKSITNSLSCDVRDLGLPRTVTLDISSILAGIRTHSLIHIPHASTPQLDELLSKWGFVVAWRKTLYLVKDPDSTDSILKEESPSHGHFELWSEYLLTTETNRELSISQNKMGYALGYPECCQHHYATADGLSSIYYSYVYSSVPYLWQLNRLSRVFSGELLGPDYFPCSMHCEHSAKLFSEFHKVYKTIYGEESYAEEANLLRSPLLIINDTLTRWPIWSIDGNTLILSTPGSMSLPLMTIFGENRPIKQSSQAILIPANHLGDISKTIVITAAGDRIDLSNI
jgi:hypothetical protein